MKKINSKGMMQGAIALSIAAFIAKILSAVYRVPFQNMVGNTGFYVYQQVYPIYGIGMTFALTGFPVFVSNVVAEYLESTHLKKLLKQLFVIASLIGVGIFAFLHLGAGMIAHWMGDVPSHHQRVFPRELSDDANRDLASGGAGCSCCGNSVRGESIR